MGDQTRIIDHESRLAVIESTLILVREEVKSTREEGQKNTEVTKAGFKEILDILKGTNGAGHSTRLTVVEKSTNRLWKFVGAVALALALGFISKAIGV